MQKRYGYVLDTKGNPVAGATVAVTIAGTTTVATLYSDNVGVTQIANPVATDADGYYQYYAVNGRYTENITTNAGTETISDLLLQDIQDHGSLTLDSIVIGTGDVVTPYVGDTSTGQLVNITSETAAVPNNPAISSPLVRINRTIQAPDGVFGVGTGNSGYTNCAGLRVVTKSTTAGKGQPVGIVGEAIHSGVDSIPGSYTGQSDALGVTGLRFITGSGTGIGIGGYFEGSTASSAGLALGAEFRARNNRGTADTVTALGSSYTRGIKLTPGGANGAASLCGVAMCIEPNILGTGNVQWDVGLGFAKYSGVSSVLTTSFLDETDSAKSIHIKGTHATASILLENSAGSVILGQSNRVVIGHSASQNGAGGFARNVQITGNSGTGMYRFSADTSQYGLELGKSRHATIGSHTILQAGDFIGQLTFVGSDGAAFQNSAAIRSVVEGTPSVGNVAAGLDFATVFNGGGSTLVSRMKINNVGDIFLQSSGFEIATNATVGFVYLPTCNGIPTGVPANLLTGTVAEVYDRANNKKYVYNGGWKASGTYT